MIGVTESHLNVTHKVGHYLLYKFGQLEKSYLNFGNGLQDRLLSPAASIGLLCSVSGSFC